MANARSYDAAADEGAPFQDAPPVFIDTNIDTHMALTVSLQDTVADLKWKARVEHAACFPKIGDINVLAMKVRRRAAYYHLSDSMLARTAFEGIKGTWFLHLDVSPASGNCNVLEDCANEAFSPAKSLDNCNQPCISNTHVNDSGTKSMLMDILGESENLRQQMDLDVNVPENCKPSSKENAGILNDQVKMDDDNGVSVNGDIPNDDVNKSGDADLLKPSRERIRDEEHETDHIEEHQEANGPENIPADLTLETSEIPVEDFHQRVNDRPSSPMLHQEKKRNKKRKAESKEDSSANDTNPESFTGKEPSKDVSHKDTIHKDPKKSRRKSKKQPTEGDTSNFPFNQVNSDNLVKPAVDLQNPDRMEAKPLDSTECSHENATMSKREKLTRRDKRSSKRKPTATDSEKCTSVNLEAKKQEKTQNQTTGDSHLESLEVGGDLSEERDLEEDSSIDSRRFRVAIRKVSKRRAQKLLEKSGLDQDAERNGDDKITPHD